MSNSCENGAMCVDGVASFTCDCAPGFTDRNCSTSEKKYSMRSINLEFIDLLFPQTLTNVSGSCVSMVEPVWTESTRDLVIAWSVTRATSATWVRSWHSPASHKISNLYKSSKMSFKDIDDCANQTCHNNGACIDLVNDFQCDCAAGYTGINCEFGISFSYIKESYYIECVGFVSV